MMASSSGNLAGSSSFLQSGQTTGDPCELADSSVSSLRLLYWKDSVQETLSFPRSLLKRRSRMNISTRFEDVCFYILEPWTLTMLADKDRFGSLKHDFIPFLIRKQFMTREKMEDRGFPEESFAATQLPSHSMSSSRRLPVFPGEDYIRCFAYVNDTDSICMRVTDHSSLMAMNEKFCLGEIPSNHNLWSVILNANHKDQLPEGIVAPHSIIGEGGHFGVKGRIANSVVGNYCKIGENVRITNSLIFKAVTIEDGVEVTNSIVCENCILRKNAEIRGCSLSAQQEIGENEKLTNRKVGSINFED